MERNKRKERLEERGIPSAISKPAPKKQMLNKIPTTSKLAPPPKKININDLIMSNKNLHKSSSNDLPKTSSGKVLEKSVPTPLKTPPPKKK